MGPVGKSKTGVHGAAKYLHAQPVFSAIAKELMRHNERAIDKDLLEQSAESKLAKYRNLYEKAIRSRDPATRLRKLEDLERNIVQDFGATSEHVKAALGDNTEFEHIDAPATDASNQAGEQQDSNAEIFEVAADRDAQAEDSLHAPEEAFHRIKAIHAAGAFNFTPEETIDILRRPVHFGLAGRRPPTIPPGRRGPKPQKTAYDHAYELRRDLYRLLVKLPAQSANHGWARREVFSAVLDEVAGNKEVAESQKVSAVIARLARLGCEAPSKWTVRRALNRREKR